MVAGELESRIPVNTNTCDATCSKDTEFHPNLSLLKRGELSPFDSAVVSLRQEGA